MKRFLVMLLLAAACFAQSPTASQVTISEEPPRDFYTKLTFKSGSDIFYCTAKSNSPQTLIAGAVITAGSVTTFTVSGGHGFNTYTAPLVTVVGATGSWASLNGQHKITVVDSTTFTVSFNSSALGAVTGSVVVNTSAPRTNQPVWAVSKSSFDSSGFPAADLWANGGWTNICDNRASLSFQ